MAKRIGSFLCAMLVGGALLAVPALAQDQTLEGVVSNTHCGLKHSTADASAAGCVNTCVNSRDAKYALVVGDKVYTLEGKKDEVAKLAGVKAKVTGHLDGMTVQVASVAAGS